MLNRMLYAGLDLAAKEKNYSALCILDEKKKIIFIGLIKKDKEIKKFLLEFKAKIIAIDAPLTKARKDRKAEKALRQKGFRPLSLKLKSMQELAKRGLKLKKYFQRKGIIVIETLPSAIKIKKKFQNKHINDAYKAALVARAYGKKKAKNIEGIFILK